MKFLILIILLLPCTTHAMDTQDIMLESGWQILHYIDYKQTIEIANNPQDYRERNPILGNHPSEGKVNTYFAITSALHLITWYLLPDKYRTWFEIITITGTSACVINNYSIGVRF
jgi:hypothetical protein